MAARITPKFRVPLEMGATGFRTVEQDSDDEVAQCVYAILATQIDTRLEEPGFGVEDPTFETGGADFVEWRQAVADWEPRAEIAPEQTLDDVGVDEILVRVRA